MYVKTGQMDLFSSLSDIKPCYEPKLTNQLLGFDRYTEIKTGTIYRSTFS